MLLHSLTRSMWAAIALSAVILLLCALPVAGFNALALWPTDSAEFHPRQLFSAHLVHFTLVHALMNVAGLLLTSYLLLTHLSLLWSLATMIGLMVFVGGGLTFIDDPYTPYAGFSGVLHGVLVMGFVTTPAYALHLRILGLGLIGAKLIHEALPTFDASSTEALIQATVAVEAHQWGAAGGVILGLTYWMSLRRTH